MSNITVLRLLSFVPSSGLTTNFSDKLLWKTLILYPIPFHRAITRLNRNNLNTQSFGPLSGHRKKIASFYFAKIYLMSISFISKSFIWKFWWDRCHLVVESQDFSHRRNGEEIEILIFIKNWTHRFLFYSSHSSKSSWDIEIFNSEIPLSIQNSSFNIYFYLDS